MLLWIVLIAVAIIVLFFVYSNYKVARANKYFYSELLKLGFSSFAARVAVQKENENYQNRIKSGERGLMLIDHLNEVLQKKYSGFTAE